MLNINRVTLLGHAGRDPDIRTLKGGEKTASFSLATTARWKDRNGEAAEATEWHRIAVYGGAVEPVERLVKKGTAVLIEGRLSMRSWQDREGTTQRVTEIVVAGPHGMVNVLSRSPATEDSGDEAA